MKLNAHFPPRTNTFSICAVDPKTGEAGVATASRAMAVGALIPYAEFGVGAIASQAVADPWYGRRGMELLRAGIPAAEAMRRLTNEDVTVTDPDPQIIAYYEAEQMRREGVDFVRDKTNNKIIWFTRRIRQVGIVDRHGNAAVHTGECTFPEGGGLAGKGYCCVGGMLASKSVLSEMAAAFEKSRDTGKSMLRSLLAALEAGEAAGGDKRGKRSAALLIMRDRYPWIMTDRWCDVRVDDDDNPIPKLVATALKYEET